MLGETSRNLDSTFCGEISFNLIFRINPTARSFIRSCIICVTECDECNSKCNGKTKRRLEKKVKEHIIALRKGFIMSSIANHLKLFDHLHNRFYHFQLKGKLIFALFLLA